MLAPGSDATAPTYQSSNFTAHPNTSATAVET